MKIANHKTVFDFIKSEGANYKHPIPINDVWRWSMKDHIKTAVLYTNSQLLSGKDDFTPVKNIVLPILNLQHRAEDIEVKDVQIYVDDSDKYHLSFLVKKYHDDVFVIENDIDTFFDELNVSRIDLGAGLSKQLDKPRPEVVPLESIAFCDQTDMLSGPIGIKHFFSPDQLMDMESVGWGKKENGATITVDELINLSREEKQEDKDGETAKTPGRYIEIYEVHGNLPKRFANPEESSNKYETRIYIVAFYQKEGVSDKQGVILYTKPEKKSPFKLIKRDKIYGRALGRGGVEELIEPQAWVNYTAKRKMDMIDAASKTILGAIGNNSSIIAQRNKINSMDNNEILDLGDGDLKQIDTTPRSMTMFNNEEVGWENHAKDLGGAQDPIQGKEPTSGTPFSSLIEQVRQGMGLHEYRRGQYAKHLEEIYYDWIIPHIQRKITQGAKFLSELSLEELQYVTECVVRNETNKRIKDMVLAGETPTAEGVELFKQLLTEEFKKKGNKHFIEILKGEFNGVTLGVKVSVAGKSKDLSAKTDKLVNIFRQIIVNPAVLQIPAIARVFNDILESSGLDPVDFSGMTKEQIAATQPQTSPVSMKEVAPQTYA